MWIVRQIIFFASCLILCASVGSYFEISRPYTQSDLDCLRNTNQLDFAISTAIYQHDTDRYLAQNLQFIAQAGTISDITMQLDHTGIISPDLEAIKLVNSFRDAPVRMYWVDPGFNLFFKPTCQFLQEFAISVRKYSGRNVGFYTNEVAWVVLFENIFNCAELGEYPLFYWCYGCYPGIVVDFGGWKTWDVFMKGSLLYCKIKNGYQVIGKQ